MTKDFTNVLSRKAVLASLTFSYWGGRCLDKKITKEVQEQHNAKRDAGRYHKRLVSQDAMKKVYSVMGAARAYHYQHTQPWLDGGTRVLPTALYLEYAATIQGYRHEFEAAVSEFVHKYPDMIPEAKASLGGMFKESDYPSPTTIRSHFDFGLNIMPCPDTADFRIALGNEHVDEIQRGLEKKLKEAMRGSIEDSVERIQEVVGHMAERLKAYKPAQEKGDKAEGVFRESLVENVKALAEVLPAFNMTDDPKLAKIAAAIKEKLCKHDAETLREQDGTRARVAKDADKILKDVSAFMA